MKFKELMLLQKPLKPSPKRLNKISNKSLVGLEDVPNVFVGSKVETPNVFLFFFSLKADPLVAVFPLLVSDFWSEKGEGRS